jgi:hypothetical protein
MATRAKGKRRSRGAAAAGSQLGKRAISEIDRSLPSRTRFVPHGIVRATMVSVIPACALACGSGGSTHADGGGPLGVADIGYDGSRASSGGGLGDGNIPLTVAVIGYDGALGVAFRGYDAGSQGGPGGDAAAAPDVFLGVAAVAFRGYEGGAAPPDAGPSDAHPDVFRGPMPLAVTAYEGERPKRG